MLYSASQDNSTKFFQKAISHLYSAKSSLEECTPDFDSLECLLQMSGRITLRMTVVSDPRGVNDCISQEMAADSAVDRLY